MTTNREAIARDSALKENIRNLMQMSDRMREETTNLTRALKGDTQKQGAWGEVVLERVLEMSGLEKGREYIIQDTRTNADNRTVRPDVTLYMPDGKHLVIDSKVSLKHYEQAVNAESPETQANFLKQPLLIIFSTDR